jgi:2-dehydropantoate 2-reductase
MRFAILGAGGVGGYYGGLLAKNGHDVCVLARTSNLAALKERGLEVRTPEGSFTVPIKASDNVENFGGVDCALLAVKNYSLAEVAPAAAFLATQGALIVPLLNGVEVVSQLVAHGVPQFQLVGGLTAISTIRVAPGVFERRSPFQRVVLGELGQSQPERKQRIDAIAEDLRTGHQRRTIGADSLIHGRPSARGQILFPVRCAGRLAVAWLSSASFLCAAWRRILPAGCLRRQRWFHWPWLGWIVVPRRQKPRGQSPELRW